jgi:hypothetical protein
LVWRVFWEDMEFEDLVIYPVTSHDILFYVSSCGVTYVEMLVKMHDMFQIEVVSIEREGITIHLHGHDLFP